MIVVIDNYDSFVFNIARYFHELGEPAEVIRNDAVGVPDLVRMKPRAVVISPGPCTPREAGISMAAIHALSGRVPILGICLGHQCIGSVFGGEVVRARQPRHGRGALISHDGNGLFAGLPSPHGVGLYHSLAIEVPDSNASPLLVTARSADGDIMAVAHRSHPTYGVQFHPESILTQQGHRILANFLAITGEAAMTAAL